MKKVYLTKEEKERKVIELLQKGANIREISKRVRISFTDIGKISRKVSGYPEPVERSGVYSKHSQALEMFRTGHSNLQVAIKVGLSDYETLKNKSSSGD
jgi:transposase